MVAVCNDAAHGLGKLKPDFGVIEAIGFTLNIGVNAELKIPKSAEVKFPTFTGPVISRVQ